MSVAGQARHISSGMELLYEARKETKILHALIRDQGTRPATVSSRPIGTAFSVPGSLSNMNVFTEPIAFHPKPFIISSDEPDTLRIDKNFGAYSTRIIVTGNGGVADNIEFIIGLDDGLGNTGKAAFAGQLLIIDAVLTTPLTLIHGSDISLPNATNVEIPGGENVSLIYDSTQDKWNLFSGVGGGAGGAAQTPWLSDINAADLLLTNLGGLRFSEIFGAGTPLRNNIFTNTLNSWLVIQTKSSDRLVFMDGDNISLDRYASLDKTLLDFSLSLGSELRVQSLNVLNLSNFKKDMFLITSSGFPRPDFSISQIVTDADDGGDLGKRLIPWNNLNIEQIRLRAGDVIIDIPSITSQGNNMILNVNTGDRLEVRVLNASVGSWSAALFEVSSAQMNLGNSTADGIGIIAELTTSIIPKFNNAIDIGRSDRLIKKLFVGNRMRIPTGSNLFD